MSLKEVDEDLYNLIEAEKERQRDCIELIASENFTSKAVKECLGSCLTNKYAEGQPGARYYGGTEVVDKIELLCQERALKAFGLDDTRWGVNVQPYLGSPANLAVYTGLLKPHDRIMGLDLNAGGHLTHGFAIMRKIDGKLTYKPVSASSMFYESMPYSVNPTTGLLDYDDIRKRVEMFKPKLLICGGSAYPREWNYAILKDIAESVGAYLMADIAHISGLVATGEARSPFFWCDVVTTTTHKSLRGPRAGMIFFKKEYETAINSAVFPALQGGPHMHQIAALATQLREVMTPEFKEYAKQVRLNAKTLATRMKSRGIKLVTDGTDNHLILIDLKPYALTGGKFQLLCDAVGITLNKNTIPGDIPAIPTGVRIGTPAMTTRGLKCDNFEEIGEFLVEVIILAKKFNLKYGSLEDWKIGIRDNAEVISEIRERVRAFARKFDMP